MSTLQEAYQSLPAVDKLLCNPRIEKQIAVYGKETVSFAIRQSIDYFRQEIKNTAKAPSEEDVFRKIQEIIDLLNKRSLRKVYNATGIIIHTNLGRSPYGEDLLKDSFAVLTDYNNLEFDLESGKRGNRTVHAKNLLKFLCGAEDVLLVNNAAAAVMLCLNTFANNKEVIVSRGELVEIGGSFRVPEIMAASHCNMVEVGTTNKTKASDYINAITENTTILFKAHKSNYIISGFTEELSLSELVAIGKEHHLPVIYDQGSGLIKKFKDEIFKNEPNVKESLEKGVDIICFSGDKLLGGPQAGIIAGKKEMIDRLKKNPMLRALRLCKTTIALLETACSYYLREEDLYSKNKLYQLYSKSIEEIDNTANLLANELKKHGIPSTVVDNEVQIGGGSLPDKLIPSRAVTLNFEDASNKERSTYAEEMHAALLLHDNPILGILKKGNILFDVRCLADNDIKMIADTIIEVHNTLMNKNTAQ
jgi:L-seryl-tRNA(Ser) seleniumtransferase